MVKHFVRFCAKCGKKLTTSEKRHQEVPKDRLCKICRGIQIHENIVKEAKK